MRPMSPKFLEISRLLKIWGERVGLTLSRPNIPSASKADSSNLVTTRLATIYRIQPSRDLFPYFRFDIQDGRH
jgi:hypothetical protein